MSDARCLRRRAIVTALFFRPLFAIAIFTYWLITAREA